MENIYLKDISSLKIRIVLSLVIKYILDRIYSINYKLYKNLKNNTI